LQEAVGEPSPPLRTFANIRMKQLNVWPLLILLVAIIFIIIWLKP
jgi:hypothetical protein